MHKQLINQSKIMVDISPVTPLLIKSGIESADPSLPDMNFVRTHHPEYGEIVYIPGSSFKGILRSYTEKILRTLEIPCCNPASSAKFDGMSKGGCGNGRTDRDEEKMPKNTELNAGARIYRDWSCFACKIYGSTSLSSRLKCVDGYPTDGDFRTEKRTGVAIDRVLGSAVGGALFDQEVVTSGIFRCEIFLSNFQLWQLGLVGLVLRDLDEGYVQMGFAKSRGLGRVKADIHSVEITCTKRPPAGFEGLLYGVGVFNDLADLYGFLKKDAVPTQKQPVRGFRTVYCWDGNEAKNIFEGIIGKDTETEVWKAFLDEGAEST